MTTSTINHFNPMFKSLRLGTSASLAVAVTAALILMMSSLIAMDPPELVEDNIRIPVITMPEDRQIKARPEPDIEKPLPPVAPPETPKANPTINPVDPVYAMVAPVIGPGQVALEGGGNSGSALPIFKVQPVYPSRPQARGIEGYVDLMFDIGPSGKTENIRILYAEPEGMFERASIRALQKWKYQPALEEGVARTQRNQTTRIRFTLNN